MVWFVYFGAYSMMHVLVFVVVEHTATRAQKEQTLPRKRNAIAGNFPLVCC